MVTLKSKLLMKTPRFPHFTQRIFWKRKREAKLVVMAEFSFQNMNHSYATLTPPVKTWKHVDYFLKATIILILKLN